MNDELLRLLKQFGPYFLIFLGAWWLLISTILYDQMMTLWKSGFDHEFIRGVRQLFPFADKLFEFNERMIYSQMMRWFTLACGLLLICCGTFWLLVQ